MQIKNILHGSFLVEDIDKALAFYCQVLHLQADPTRPDLGYPGAWLNVNPEQQIHLLQLHNPDPTIGRPEHVGKDRHIAFSIDDIDLLTAKLDQESIPYTKSRSGRRAVFCRDPDGNGLEFIEQG